MNGIEDYTFTFYVQQGEHIGIHKNMDRSCLQCRKKVMHNLNRKKCFVI